METTKNNLPKLEDKKVNFVSSQEKIFLFTKHQEGKLKCQRQSKKLI